MRKNDFDLTILTFKLRFIRILKETVEHFLM